MVITVPIRTVMGQNAREHWGSRARRVKSEKEATWLCLHGKPKPAIPCEVVLTRLSPNKCDDDNLEGALKSVRDAIAIWLGVDDGDERVKYRYAQLRTVRNRPNSHSVAIQFKEST